MSVAAPETGRARLPIQVTSTRGQRPPRSGDRHTFTFTAGRRRRRRQSHGRTRVATPQRAPRCYEPVGWGRERLPFLGVRNESG